MEYKGEIHLLDKLIKESHNLPASKDVNKKELKVKDAKIESLKKQLKEQENLSEAVNTKH